MTQKKNIASKLVLVLFVLTLLSCCLLGSTFARYVSGGNGSASVGIAKWDVDMAEGAGSVEIENISPSKEAVSEDGSARTHSSGVHAIGVISNKGEVAARVTVSAAGRDYTMAADGAGTFGGGMSWNDNAVTGTPSREQVDAILVLNLYYDNAEAKKVLIGEQTVIELAAGASTTLYAEVVWTSAEDADTGISTGLADEIDTWIGENIESVVASITWTAVQASELPTT